MSEIANEIKNNRTLFLSDDPKESEDAFQVHSDISETLFNIVQKHDVSKNSFTIGLFGEWGSGKSFIINKLSKIIAEKGSGITFINIDVWKYSGQPLLRSILFELNKHFKSLYKKDELKYEPFKDGYRNTKKKSLQDLLYYDEVFESESELTNEDFKMGIKALFKKYEIPYLVLLLLFVIFIFLQIIPLDSFKTTSFYKILEPILAGSSSFWAFITGTAIFINLFKKPLNDLGNLVFFRNTVKNFTEKANFSSEQFEGIFIDILSKIKHEKYVIVFDNIDRCEPHVAYETLSTIKTFMDVNNCFYIIPADDDAIKHHLTNSDSNAFKRNFTEEFIDKIFQTYIRIPLLKEVERDEYIKKQLKKVDFNGKLTDVDISVITEILYFAYKGESPRNIIRFINDYSTYFQLALKSLPILLENITLFTIMIAIKQKWYTFEAFLVDRPTFFSDYLNNQLSTKEHEVLNETDIKEFLEKISTYYIPQITKQSLDSYIHFKEGEQSLIISELLKNNIFSDFDLNSESIKILLNEFKKNIQLQGAFAQNSFNALKTIIINNLDHQLSNELIKQFWLGYINSPKTSTGFIFSPQLSKEKKILMINTLNRSVITHHKKTVEQKIQNYLREPIIEKKENSAYSEILQAILESNFVITPTIITSLFSNWEIDNLYLNSFIKLISDLEKTDYLPNSVIEKLLSANLNRSEIEILQNWDHENIPKKLGMKLAEIVKTRLNSRISLIGNAQQLIPQIPTLIMDYDLLILIDKSTINAEMLEPFIQSICDVTNRIFQFANAQKPNVELAIKYWIEIAYFAELKLPYIDNKMDSIFKQYFVTNSAALVQLFEFIKYPDDLLSLNILKQTMFQFNNGIPEKILEVIDDKHFSDFDLIFPRIIEKEYVQMYRDRMQNKDINEVELSSFLLKRVIKELLDDKKDVSAKIQFLKSEFNLSLHKQSIIENKNGIIDFYKEKPAIGINIYQEIKELLTNSELFTNFLKPILLIINSELKKSEQLLQYLNLSVLIESTENKENLKLLYSISEQCLEKNQDIKENLFAIKILEKIYPSLDKDQKGNLMRLISENDNINQWDNENKEKLKNIGLLLFTEDEDEKS